MGASAHESQGHPFGCAQGGLWPCFHTGGTPVILMGKMPMLLANTLVPFGGVAAKYVKLTVEKNWSAAAPQTGLSEVRFFATQSPAAPQP